MKAFFNFFASRKSTSLGAAVFALGLILSLSGCDIFGSIFVTTTSTLPPNCTIYVSGSGSDANDGLTASAPKATLSAAIELAKLSYNSKLYVSGNFSLNPDYSGTGWYIDYADSIEISGGWNSNFTAQDSISVLNGDCTHIVYFESCENVTFENFVITGADAGSYDNGAGIYIDYSCNLTINCTVTSNSANYGGGIALYGSDYNTISGYFCGNHAYTTAGGVFLDSGSDYNTIESVILNNTAVEKGAGMAFYQAMDNMISATITNNFADTYGGGVYLSGSSYNEFTSNCVIMYNHCDADDSGTGDGGAIYINSGDYNVIDSGAVTTPNFLGSGTDVTNDLYGI